MPPKKDLSIRLSAELRDALDRAAAQSGETITAIVERALAAHLGVMQGPTLADRVRALEIAVANLQRNAGQRPTLSPDNAMQRPTPATGGRAGQYRASPKPPSQAEGDSTKADGQQWLTTKQALSCAQKQGFTQSESTFRRLNNDQLKALSLARTGYQGRDNSMASYRVIVNSN